MTPLPLLNLSAHPPHSPSPTSPSDRPERSRNAKAQARHRAKRKAYIEQLEQTVVRLQHALAGSPDQMASIPPPVRLRELEQENLQLHREVELLRQQLEERNARLRPDIGQRTVGGSPTLDHRPYDHEYRQRRSTFAGEMQVSSSSQLSSPPTLSMPPVMHNYSHSPHSPSMSNERSSSVSSGTSYGAFSYHMPETPPSSATSSPSTPSFSASPADPYAHYVPRADHSPQQPYHSGGVSPYGIVKVEEESYQASHDAPSDPNGYTLPTLYSASQPMHSWGTPYPSRA